ncbi:MAG TPA: 3-phosphoshikimate 1-carboxyvinyltransferase [Pseudomonadota bacterium]|nr:3-phosphoshikimate 1-carboxyvinyltransferase [Pseudomonadota bacterium]
MSGAATLDWLARPAQALRGRVRVPGDKSISHRAMMLGSLAEGVTRVRGFLEGEDTLATAAAFRTMGVRIDAAGAGERVVHGVGLGGLQAPRGPIDCGNAGTGMRLLAGVLAAQPFPSILVGDDSLSRRPMRRVLDPLARMGARIDASAAGTAPLRIAPATGGLHGIDYESPVASAQVKSCVLLAGLRAAGRTRVAEPHPTRDHTERMLEAFGWPVERDGRWTGVRGGARLQASDIEVPADFSSAAFFLVAASIVPGSELVLERVGLNPLRTGLLHALRLMGADIEVQAQGMAGGEPIGDLRVRHAPLRGIEVPVELVPDMIDEFPALFAAAACATGPTTVRGAAELRVKESDRIAVMAAGLRGLGVPVREHDDGATIDPAPVRAGAVASAGDHRCAMSFAVLAAAGTGVVRIGDCANVATSFPGFVELATAAGMELAAAPRD